MLYRMLIYSVGLLLAGMSCLMTWAIVQVNIHYLWIVATALSFAADGVVLTPWAVQLIRYHLFGTRNIKLWTVKEACQNWGAVFIALYVLLCAAGFVWFGYSYYITDANYPKSILGFWMFLSGK